jgi:methionyl-tRNA formyltransferase
VKFYVFDDGSQFGSACKGLATELGFERVQDAGSSDVALAPMLLRRLHEWEYKAPRFGTLVFHPSALPYRRGLDSIKHAIAAGERVSASTWFWCDVGWDTGDVCEQEVVVLLPGERPRDAYEKRFVPAGLAALRRALLGVAAGRPRRVPQDPALVTYDGKFTRPTA